MGGAIGCSNFGFFCFETIERGFKNGNFYTVLRVLPGRAT